MSLHYDQHFKQQYVEATSVHFTTISICVQRVEVDLCNISVQLLSTFVMNKLTCSNNIKVQRKLS